MSEWKEYKLGEIAEIVGGGTPDTSNKEYWGGNIPWLTPKDLTGYNKIFISSGERFITEEGLDNSSTKLLPQGTVLLSSRAPIGYVAIASNPICTNQGFKSIICNKDIVDNLYMYYWIKNNTELLQSLGTGTTFAEISGSVVKSIAISLPPLPEQKHIASILSSLDDKIDLLHRENKTLEAMAETLFRQWFIEEAKEDWEEGKLGDEFEFIMGQSPSGESFNEEGAGIPMYQGNADFGFRFPTKRIFTTQPTKFAEINDTLISVRAPVGAQNMAIERCCIGRGVAAFRYKNNSLFYSYTYYKLKSLLNEIKQYNDNGTVFGSISKSDFENLDIVIPDKDTILNFQKQVKPIDDKIINNNNEIQTLIQTRDGLLSRLMSGEVKI
jgi:type I restriction enzyme S subunit